MYYLLVRKRGSDYMFKGRSANYCIYGNDYRSGWWSYTIKEAIENYLTKNGRSCTGTLEECLISGGNHIVAVLPFEVLDADYIIDHHPEFFI